MKIEVFSVCAESIVADHGAFKRLGWNIDLLGKCAQGRCANEPAGRFARIPAKDRRVPEKVTVGDHPGRKMQGLAGFRIPPVDRLSDIEIILADKAPAIAIDNDGMLFRLK